MTHQEALENLTRYFDSTYWPYGMSYRSFMKNVFVPKEQTMSDYTIIGIRRHECISPARYFPGCAMSACATRLLSYAVHDDYTKTIVLEDESVKVSVDTRSLANEVVTMDSLSLSIDLCDDGYHVVEGVSKFDKLVVDKDHAISLVIEEFVPVESGFFEEKLRDLECISDEEISSIIHRYEVDLIDELRQEVTRCWEQREPSRGKTAPSHIKSKKRSNRKRK